jgi:uncharacterized protein DUF3592
MRSDARRRPPKSTIGYLLGAIGCGVLTLLFVIGSAITLRTGIRTHAKVVQTAVGPGRDVIVEFRTGAGPLVRAQVSAYDVGFPDTGDSVRVRYPPDDPSFVSGMGTGAVEMRIGTALLSGAVTVGLAAVAHHRRRRRH